jgi:hypothetical protein
MMKRRNHVVVVVSLVVLGASAVLGATVQSSSPCLRSGSTIATENVATSTLCASGIDVGCAIAIPVHQGQHLVEWGISQGCFGPKL